MQSFLPHVGSARPGPAPAGTARLGPAAKAWRAVVVVLLAAAYLAGSLVGDDHWWPFGPWRMYSTSSAPGGVVSVFAVQVTTDAAPGWADTPVTLPNLGLNRAELEGRAPLVESDPAVLATLADAHARLHPGDEAWTGVRVLRRSTVLEGRRPTGEVREEVVATWRG